MHTQTDPTTQSKPTTTGFRFREKLPHIEKEGVTYFVTFRLADSLPAAEIIQLKHERDTALEQAASGKASLRWQERQRLFADYSDKVEALLDAGRGECWLKRPEIAEVVANAMHYFNHQRYELHAWVVMPNHVHAILFPMPGFPLGKILMSWKAFTSREANRILCRDGKFWQPDAYDRWIRNDDEQARLVEKLENDPVKAGFCRTPSEWKWSSANRHWKPSTPAAAPAVTAPSPQYPADNGRPRTGSFPPPRTPPPAPTSNRYPGR